MPIFMVFADFHEVGKFSWFFPIFLVFADFHEVSKYSWFLDASLHLYKRVCPLVRQSVTSYFQNWKGRLFCLYIIREA